MSHWIDIAAITLATTLLVPVAVLCAECLAACLAPRRRPAPDPPPPDRPPLAILIPAHNEELGLPTALRSITPQLLPHDRLLVVADNCTDATAAVARDHGASVIERTDPLHRGKGYALDRGIRELEPSPPQIVVMVDADCRLTPGTLTALATQVAATGKPAQASYVMDCPTNAGPRAGVSALAFIVKNVVRPLGLHQLCLPCLLTGTGMAFPWSTIHAAHLATGNIVEDMQLGIDLALAGHAPKPCPDARVLGTIESQSNVAYKQRARWEHGHLQTLLTAFPRLALASIRFRRPTLFALALEVAVPPLALLVLLLLTGLAVSLAWARAGGSPVPAAMLASGAVALVVMTLLAWARFARRIVPFRSLAAVPFYVAWKIPLYVAFLFRREKQWVRTYRGTLLPAEPADRTPGSCVLNPARP